MSPVNFFPEGRSKPLSGFALAAAALCGWMTLKTSYDLFTLMEVFSTPAFYLALARSTLPVELPPLGVVLARNMRLVFFFSVFFWLSCFTLSVGVWKRREWARRGAVAMLYLLGAAALLLLFFPWVAIPRPLVHGELQLAPEFNQAVGAAAFLARLGGLLAGGLCLWWALALDRGELKKEFPGPTGEGR
ncbi:MAG: hypothetical protein HY550_02180 [Elusimicrobia bacterium]|nr:hypothetical protein [Elusimicrobiota bacterium]